MVANRFFFLVVAVVSSASCATRMHYMPTEGGLISASYSCGMPSPAAKIISSNRNIAGYLRLFPNNNVVYVTLDVVAPKAVLNAQTVDVVIDSQTLRLERTGLSSLATGDIGSTYGAELRVSPPARVSVLIPSLGGNTVNSGHSIDFELQSETHLYSCLQ